MSATPKEFLSGSDVIAVTEAPATPVFRGLFAAGFALLRERLAAYGFLAFACAATAAAVFHRVDLLRVFAGGDPVAIMRTPPINVILMTALIAIFFVLPSALRRIEPSFKMTMWRALITALTLFFVGVATEVGYAAAVIPGIVIGVLLSQTLINALLRTGERATAREAITTIVGAASGSFKLTREHFMTTLWILIVSLAILAIPFLAGLIAMIVLDALEPPSLIVTAPALFAAFIYAECTRYVLIVRWYRHLEAAHAKPSVTVTAASRRIA